jgi:hypothetical protein
MGQVIHTQALVQMLDQQGEVVVCIVYRNTPGEERGRLDIWVPQFDSQTQKAEFKLRPQNTHGIDFVWLGENPAVLGVAEWEAITHKPGGGEVTQDVSGIDNQNVTAEKTPPPPKKHPKH